MLGKFFRPRSWWMAVRMYGCRSPYLSSTRRTASLSGMGRKARLPQ